MIVDFHTHVFPEKIALKTLQILSDNSKDLPYTNGMETGLISSMLNANVNLSVVLPVMTKPSQFDSINAFAFELNERYSNAKYRIISFGGIHPDCDDIDGKMKFLRNKGFLGVKIHPDFQNTFINDEKYIKIINAAKENDLIVVTHSGVDNGYPGQPVKCTPDLVLETFKRTNYNKLVLAHFGAHKMWNEVLDKLCDLDVYFDTAFTLHEIDRDLFCKIVNKHGADRVLFATDSPWRDLQTDLEIFKSLNLDKKDLDKILYKNAIKLLGI